MGWILADIIKLSIGDFQKDDISAEGEGLGSDHLPLACCANRQYSTNSQFTFNMQNAFKRSPGTGCLSEGKSPHAKARRREGAKGNEV